MRSPSWIPDEATIASANVTVAAAEVGHETFGSFHAWSASNREEFWDYTLRRLGVVFRRPPDGVLTGDARSPGWLAGGRCNIAESVFLADPDKPAIIHRSPDGTGEISYGELRSAANRFANGLVRDGFTVGDRVAIAMLMNVESVIAYLGTVLAGGVVVSIADSFAAEEIATRLRIADAHLVVTQGVIARGGKTLPMYEKIVGAGADRAIVLDPGPVPLRTEDVTWDDFLSESDDFEPVIADVSDPTNILFSSGTTGEPKAIAWTHLTPIKAAADGHYHQDIKPSDVVAWPTNLGWMMGPWLIYASLVNKATMALYDDVPSTREFVQFVSDAGVSVLGVVPSLVAAWRATSAFDGIDVSTVRVLSSTGEASNADDMDWLMTTVDAPVVEYCGGTEIGGGYISCTVVEPAVAGMFSTPCLGLDLRIIGDDGESGGELFIVPPSIGLSEHLLNRDHDAVYYSELPDSDVPLRRHGDQIRRMPNGYYRAMGRVDDTMNLGGIKVSSAEIERTVSDVEGVAEVAAIAVAPAGGGPSELVLYVVPSEAEIDAESMRVEMQGLIRAHLNPLFKIALVVPIETLPRTASAKVMRRELRSLAEGLV